MYNAQIDIRDKVFSASFVSGGAFETEGFSTLIVTDSHPPYTGEYTVIPQTVEQTLETADKYMTDDVTVREIPYYEVSNEKGTTVYIARTIDE